MSGTERRNFLASMLALGLAAALAVGFFGFSYYDNKKERALGHLSRDIERQVAEASMSFDALLNTVSTIVTASAAFMDTQNDLDAATFNKHVQTYTDRLQQHVPNLRAIISMDRGGIVQTDTRDGRPAVGVDVSDREYLKVHRQQPQDGVFISTPVSSRVDGSWTWVLSKAAYDQHGKYRAAVAASLDRRYFSEAIGSISPIEGTHFFLVHESGVVLEASSKYERAIGRPLVDIEKERGLLPYRALDNKRGVTPSSVQGLGGAHSISRFPVLLVATIEQSLIDARTRQAREDAIIMTGSIVMTLIAVFALAYHYVMTGIKRKDAAESAYEAKTKFLSSMSHELRTPMNAILGFSQLLAMQMEEKEDKKQAEDMQIILTSGQHLMKLIDDVLEFSKIEDGQTVFDVTKVDLSRLVHETQKALGERAGNHDVTLQNDVDPEICPAVMADPQRLRQSLDQLLTNAIKYGGEGCVVSVKCHKGEGRMVRLSVVDTGPGIPMERQGRVFTPFDRLGYESGTISGTGIGLNIAKSLVELMGGKIGFESREGVGTTFWIDLPRA